MNLNRHTRAAPGEPLGSTGLERSDPTSSGLWHPHARAQVWGLRVGAGPAAGSTTLSLQPAPPNRSCMPFPDTGTRSSCWSHRLAVTNCRFYEPSRCNWYLGDAPIILSVHQGGLLPFPLPPSPRLPPQAVGFLPFIQETAALPERLRGAMG